MADGNGPGRITLNGIAFAVLMLILIVVSLWLFISRPWWFPDLASVSGADIDSVFMAVLVVTGIAFIGVQGILGYFVAVTDRRVRNGLDIGMITPKPKQGF